MDFLSPAALWLLLLPLTLLAGYIWSQRRRHRYTLRYSSASLVREALGKVAILTLANALAVLLYVVLFRRR